jgi:hypothetical protein
VPKRAMKTFSYSAGLTIAAVRRVLWIALKI